MIIIIINKNKRLNCEYYGKIIIKLKIQIMISVINGIIYKKDM